MKIAYIDTETTGLNTSHDRVIEAAVSVWQLKGRELTPVYPDRVVTTIRQHVDYTVTPITPALTAVNGFYPEHPDWKGAPMAGSTAAKAQWQLFAKISADCVLAAQNIGLFDLPLVLRELAYHDVKPLWKRRVIDIQSFSHLIAVQHGFPEFGLARVYKAISTESLPEHRAEADVYRCVAVHKHVLRMLPELQSTAQVQSITADL